MDLPDQEQLIRKLCNQLESRLRNGDVGVTEQLLDSHPEIRLDQESALDLIYVEITTREAMGQSVDAAELKLRFPDWSFRIDRLMSVHRALQSDSTADQADETNVATFAARADLFDRHREGAPKRIDQYEVLGEIGRGGMGVVYKARQPELNRIVALKLIRESLGSGENGRRLIHEARTVARLDHDQIVRVYDAGFEDQLPFVCLEYVDGGSLADRLAKTTFDAKSACRMLRQLALAMEYAHQQGVIHRDLKPANILVSLDGQPKIADFGLAKTIWEQPATDLPERLTRTGAILGSLCYMSPEQVSGRDDQIGATTDVYGLGTILYEMLVGRPPFVRESPLDTAHDIQFRDAVSPRTFVPEIPRDVETICFKCLEKDPQRRFQSAADLADDLNRYLTDTPIHARPVGWPTHVCRWAKRKPSHAALIGSLFALLLTYGLLQTKHAQEISGMNTILNRSLADEQTARRQADEHFWRAFEGVSTVHRKLAGTGLEHEPRMQRARLEVVDSAIEIIAELEEERPDDVRIQTEDGQLKKLRGHILLELGRWEESLAAFSNSVSTYTAILERASDNDQIRHSCAAAISGKAEALKWLTNMDLAEVEYAKAVRELRKLSERRADDLTLQNDFAQVLVSWAAVLPPNKDEDAASVLAEADRLSDKIVKRWPESHRAFSVRGQTLRGLGNLMRGKADAESAERYYSRAISVFEQALQLAPGDRVDQILLVETAMSQSEQLQGLKKFAEARAPLERAQQLLVELQGRYPSIARYSNLRIETTGLMSLLEVNLGNQALAVELAEQAADQRRDLLLRNPDDKRAAAEFAVSLANLSNRLTLTKAIGEGRLERAEKYAREALTIPKTYSLDGVQRSQINRFARYNLILAVASQNRVQDARTELKNLASETSEDPFELRFLADAWSELLAALLRTGSQEEQLIKEVHDRTLHELERAVKAGYRDHAELKQTAALEPLRSHPRFQSLLNQLSPP